MNTTFYKKTQISYTDSGNGKTVVLLHGFLENSKMWTFLETQINKTHRVICFDLLGHGQSDCLGYVHTMEEQSDMILSVLKELKVKKASFIGHSMGGYIALAFAENYPNYIKSLVLLNSTSYQDSEERKLNRTRAIKVVKQDYTAFVSMSIANLFSENNRERLASEIELTKKEALKTPLQGIIASLEGMKVRKDRFFVLKNAPYPKMVILGRKDPVLNYNENSLQTVNTNTELVTFDDGHMSHIENKTELTTVLKKFIA